MLAHKKIMVVDQDEDVREILKYNLEKENYIVKTYKHALNAFHALDYYKPDLILINWLMPEISGFEFYNKIKKHPSITNIPIIFITCKSDVSEVTDAFGMDADNYFIKPFHLNEWMMQIKKKLNKTENLTFKHQKKKFKYIDSYSLIKNNWMRSNNRLRIL